MHVVRHQVTLDNLALLLPSQRVNNRTQLLTSLPEDGFSPSFGHEYAKQLPNGETTVREFAPGPRTSRHEPATPE